MGSKYMISTGRGGAGNIHSSETKAAPKMVRQGSQTPNIIQPVYSTGRGGAGNMRKNVDPKLTRKAQDVEECGEETDRSPDDDFINIDDVVEKSHDSDLIDDSVTPIQILKGNSVNAAISNVRSQSATANNLSGSSGRSKSRRNSIKKTSTGGDKPKAIAIGRGGAGNMLSPSASNKSLEAYLSNTSYDRAKAKKTRKNKSHKKSNCIIC
ncbi:hypothetical protein TPHA_0F03080 [Tetrapisispora phaffii CBS 4417]|uniref:Uncharacterized protein n=1 Tax=Tetrapisispora phaffii (strain ATCC 24235 / CBS 4417 / NBRC 1672 / NRRL Y-8282 / UCD 70-5) TaxID=1071381 RepID=G8BUK3_TETPH|nr:hypothetical protein TPHA_0F03080 [Tetrapisispora phaffii CBS 4417]CCE63789.1 hypothetical protein TPHA_0F03080 [Tetrapisispora phaffii CBS 4417]